MSNFNATIQAGAVTGPKVESNVGNGKLRVFTSQYTVIDGEEPQVGDTITWGTIPSGSQILGSLSHLNCSIGNAGATATVGYVDNIDEFLAATDIGTSATVTTLPLVNASGAVYVLDEDMLLTSTIAVDALLAGQVLTLRIVYVQD